MENMETSTEGVFHEARVSKSELMRTGLSIDLNLPMPVVVNGWDCQHFSIRGNPSEQLPPIGVPEHKRWWCANCIHNIGADESAVEKIVDASVNTRSTNFVFKAGVRVEETGLATDVILSKQCSTREIKTNCPGNLKAFVNMIFRFCTCSYITDRIDNVAFGFENSC